MADGYKKFLPGFLLEKKSATDLYGYMLRDTVAGTQHTDGPDFFAIVLSTPTPVTPVDVTNFFPAPRPTTSKNLMTIAELEAKYTELSNKPSKFKFRARISAIHGPLLPEPSALTFSVDPDRTINLIKQHTEFISTVGAELPTPGDLVRVRLRKNENDAWNLQYGEYIEMFDAGYSPDLAGMVPEAESLEAFDLRMDASTDDMLDKMMAGDLFEYADEEETLLGPAACAVLRELEDPGASDPEICEPLPVEEETSGELGFWDTMGCGKCAGGTCKEGSGIKFFRFYLHLDLLDSTVRPDFINYYTELQELGWIGIYYPGAKSPSGQDLHGPQVLDAAGKKRTDINQANWPTSFATSIRRSVKHQWGIKTCRMTRSSKNTAWPCRSHHQYGYAVDMNAILVPLTDTEGNPTSNLKKRTGEMSNDTWKYAREVARANMGGGNAPWLTSTLDPADSVACKDMVAPRNGEESHRVAWAAAYDKGCRSPVAVAAHHNLTWQGSSDRVHFYHKTATVQVNQLKKKCKGYYFSKYEHRLDENDSTFEGLEMWPEDFEDEVAWINQPVNDKIIASAKALGGGGGANETALAAAEVDTGSEATDPQEPQEEPA